MLLSQLVIGISHETFVTPPIYAQRIDNSAADQDKERTFCDMNIPAENYLLRVISLNHFSHFLNFFPVVISGEFARRFRSFFSPSPVFQSTATTATMGDTHSTRGFPA